MESSFKGLSIRAILALITVGTGLAFLYTVALVSILVVTGDIALQMALSIVVAIIGFINLALGYYLGQKNVGQSDTTVDTIENVTVEGAETQDDTKRQSEPTTRIQ